MFKSRDRVRPKSLRVSDWESIPDLNLRREQFITWNAQIGFSDVLEVPIDTIQYSCTCARARAKISNFGHREHKLRFFVVNLSNIYDEKSHIVQITSVWDSQFSKYGPDIKKAFPSKNWESNTWNQIRNFGVKKICIPVSIPETVLKGVNWVSERLSQI